MQFQIRNLFTGDVQFTAGIEADENTPLSIKIGLAVRWAYKTGADLSGADLSGANLRSANLRSADLSGADLSGANLRSANLRSADLSGANLRSANLIGADLSGANLRSANLIGADLIGANLRSADLSGADLSGANLRGANLIGADLIGAKGAEYTIAKTRILPEGDLIGWKKCDGGVIVRLRIPVDAPRSHAFGRKCRAAYVDVLDVYGAEVGILQHDGTTEYRVGQRVACDKWDDNWHEECSGGIHFFITRIEAENY